MSAKQRFVVGSWLLLACVCFAVIGNALWSRIDSHHRVEDRSHGWGCLDINNGAECKPPSYVVTTPNRVPAVSFFIVAGAAGIVGVVLLRLQPRPAVSRDQPASN